MVFRNYPYFAYHFNRNPSIWIFDVQSNNLFLVVILKKEFAPNVKPQLLAENLKNISFLPSHKNKSTFNPDKPCKLISNDWDLTKYNQGK